MTNPTLKRLIVSLTNGIGVGGVLGFAATLMLGCAPDLGPQEMVHVVGSGPTRMQHVSLWTKTGQHWIRLKTWDAGSRGRFEFTAHVDPSVCEDLWVKGLWFSWGTAHNTAFTPLDGCGEHTIPTHRGLLIAIEAVLHFDYLVPAIASAEAGRAIRAGE